MVYIPTEDQLADWLNKPLTAEQFGRMVAKFVRHPSSYTRREE